MPRVIINKHTRQPIYKTSTRGLNADNQPKVRTSNVVRNPLARQPHGK